MIMLKRLVYQHKINLNSDQRLTFGNSISKNVYKFLNSLFLLTFLHLIFFIRLMI